MAVDMEETGTIATTFADDDELPESERVREKSQSILTSATSFITFGGEEDGEGPSVADLSDMVLHGVQLDYGEPFECTFCRTIQDVSNRLEWK